MLFQHRDRKVTQRAAEKTIQSDQSPHYLTRANLGMEVIAEGIETEEQYQQLKMLSEHTQDENLVAYSM